MSTISCTCCHTRYASWEVKYIQDPGIYKFCYKCIEHHPTSPKYPTKAIEKKKYLNPAAQYFETEYRPACSCCNFIRTLTTITKTDGPTAKFCQDCVKLQDRSEMSLKSLQTLVAKGW